MKPLGLPFGKPEAPLIDRERKIAALLKPLGKTGLFGDANKGKSNGCVRDKNGHWKKP